MKKLLVFIFIFVCAAPASAQLQKQFFPSVVPTHNVTSLEINPAFNVLDDTGDVSFNAVTLKAYYARTPNCNFGIEVPFVRFETPGDSENGLGDIFLSATGTREYGNVSFGLRMEGYIPTATDDALGLNKWQLLPSAFVVYALPHHFFVAAGYRHYVSVAGQSNRPDINWGRIRMNLGYLSSSTWWVVADPQFYIDYDNDNQHEMILEVELGVMINPGTSLYIKPGGHLGGNWRTKDWGLSIGFKILYL